MKVLAVFPDLHDVNPGGVQVSGQLAWELLQRETEARALFVKHRLPAIGVARGLRFEPDIILFWHLDLLPMAPLLRTHAQRVLFLHGIEAWRRQGWLTRRLLKRTRCIANSHYTNERGSTFIPELRKAKSRVVHLGVGAETRITQPLQTPRGAVMIARMDRGERYKGHHEVIGVWPQVVEKFPDAQLWIVGEGSLRRELEHLVIERRLGDAVRFFGRLQETEKEDLLRAARCLVLPSRAEGFGLVYVEAMRVGRPCLVGPDAGGEVVNPPEAGLRVDPADANALAQAIASLLRDDAEWQRMSQGAESRYKTHYTAAHFQRRFLNALQELH